MIKLRITDKNGLTLIELLVAASLFSVLMIAMSGFLRDTYQFQEISYAGLTAADEARKLLRPMTNEIRSAIPSSLGAYALESTTSSEIIFFSDTDQDGLVERIRYFIDNGNLRRGKITPTGSPMQYNAGNETFSTLMRNVTALSFDYFDEDYDGTSSPLLAPFSISDVRLVRISVTIDNDPNRDPSPLAILKTEVSIRSLKGNL